VVTEAPNKSFIPEFDYEKELKRWIHVFEVMNGPEPKIGHTPKNEVWRKNKSILWHYPAKEKKYEIPMFFVYSLFGKPYILDIAPKASVIENLTNLGYDVYLLDWGSPGYEDKGISLDIYIKDYLRTAVKRALRHSGAEEISVIGYCLGGTISSIYAAIAEEPIKNLIVATVPIDFSVFVGPDKLSEALKTGVIDVNRFIDVYGVIPSSYVEGMFRSITTPITFSNYVSLVNRAHDKKFVDKWRRMNKWTTDQVPFAGEAFRQLSIDLFRDNKLVNGELVIAGQNVNLANITANLLVISSINDNLIVEEQSKPLMDLVSSEDKTYLRVEAGHVSLALTGKFAGVLHEWVSERSKPIQLIES
jgi:class III poly(R)-hydroxyalkanoic acid synthase PhaC subunit